MIETPTFSRFAAAAPHSAAAKAGRDVMSEGGNALEAMIAMAATIAVVYPHMNAFGGDGFWVVREPGGRVRYFEAAGFAGEKATVGHYRALGHDSIPTRGPLAAVTVPGAIGGWQMALDLARALGGRLPLEMLLADALGHARDGYAVSASEARGAINDREATFAAPGFADTYLVDGKMPAAGHVRKLANLAGFLSHLGTAGLDDFYRGDIGREIAEDLERIGAPVTRRDLERYRAVERTPLTVKLRAASLYNAPPPTQGLASLIILGVFDRLLAEGAVRHVESFEHHHALVEASKRALALRDRHVTDFERLEIDPAALLTPQAIGGIADRIDMGRAAPYPAPPGDGDTVWMGAIDASGLAVSYIQSIYFEYGSGCVLPRTGVLMQNRGVSFSLDPAARNPLQPGRRPFHTLNPALAALDDGRVMVYGSMGGDGQPQFQAQLYARHMLFGLSLAEAVDGPRWLLGRTWGSSSSSLKYESRFDDGLIRALDRAGHALEAIGQPYADGVGHAGGVVRHANGRLEAMHDPRSDGSGEGG